MRLRCLLLLCLLLAHLVLLGRLLLQALDVLRHRHASFLSLDCDLLSHLCYLLG